MKHHSRSAPRIATLALGIAVLSLQLGTGCSLQPPADLLLVGGKVYTLDDRQPEAEAIAIRGERIVFVGDAEQARALEGPSTRVVELGGKTVFPGFTDSHVHLASIGARETSLDLSDAASLEDLLAKLKERAAKSAPGEWIAGRGWIEARWDPPVFPTRQDLDRVSPSNPVWLLRIDHHAGVANSQALRLAGVTETTKDPPGGEILRDPKTGRPTGLLIDRARALIEDLLPADRDPRRLREALLRGAQFMLSKGWTEVAIAGNSYQEIEQLHELYRQGQIKLRIYDAVNAPGPDAERLLVEGPTIGAHGGRFTVRAIKIAVDGALGSKGAALFDKYNDHDSRGLLLWKEADLVPLLARALRDGIQVETHAIGDRANRFVLDLYEKACDQVPKNEWQVADPRWRIEHAQILHPADIPRFAALKVIASMQPSHAITDLHFAKSRLGVERLAGAYAWRSLIDAGAIIAGGSDAPVEQGDPVIEFYAAIARKDLQGYSGDHWHPEQAVSRQEALKMLTLWPAYAAFEEDHRGTIETGKWADLTVLSEDLMTVEEAGIPKAECVMTIVAGQVAFEK